MGEPGFVYVLINPSMPGLLKIGRTNRSTDERLRELNVTAVPTPFVLAYESFFDDSALAEEFVHAYLEAKGHRVSQQREFFDAPLNLVVDAILTARNRFPRGQRCAPPPAGPPWERTGSSRWIEGCAGVPTDTAPLAPRAPTPDPRHRRSLM